MEKQNIFIKITTSLILVLVGIGLFAGVSRTRPSEVHISDSARPASGVSSDMKLTYFIPKDVLLSRNPFPTITTEPALSLKTRNRIVDPTTGVIFKRDSLDFWKVDDESFELVIVEAKNPQNQFHSLVIEAYDGNSILLRTRMIHRALTLRKDNNTLFIDSNGDEYELKMIPYQPPNDVFTPNPL